MPRIAILFGCAVLAASCASQTPAPVAVTPAKPVRAVTGTVALQNPGFEEKPSAGANCAPRWGCSMHADPTSFRFTPLEVGPASGTRSYCVEAVGKEPWAKLSQAVLRDVGAVRGRRVRFSALVKLESVTGEGAGPSTIAQGAAGQTIAHAEVLAKGDRAWQRVEVEMDVPEGTSLLEVGLTFIGRGRACMDDARLEVLSPPGTV
jgi:hypothetical protein